MRRAWFLIDNGVGHDKVSQSTVTSGETCKRCRSSVNKLTTIAGHVPVECVAYDNHDNYNNLTKIYGQMEFKEPHISLNAAYAV
ncbi:predicted protein [Sclerotinia sclerotiorum 1980 UF-70]|uniref:Uncharacterized protein n=1 Tax=Sclerotinia sclerotiorum (strain ATCC 18683 / 1980 / Ss-1) TaxID=665079 RepID=A7F1M3_SCLS1|nr:predicted protein [Sclerotinia sclerotiorum 1980 UF-70]EDN95615.1 predicted protein [Sclerotinia sclerotiorum 1980 UF-70]